MKLARAIDAFLVHGAIAVALITSQIVVLPVCAQAANPIAPIGQDGPAIAIHPENHKYFLFRGKAAFLLTASEHYGSVLNRPFNYRKYLDDLVDKHMSLTRTFLLYRELP